MSEEPAIVVDNVSKAYRIWTDPAARLKAPLTDGLSRFLPLGSGVRNRVAARASSYYRDFYALRHISFQIAKGEGVGIIGRNGSGKSTLLQIIAGTMQPTSGTVQVNGRVAALLELGSGFNPEFTGRENVYLNATVLGLSRSEIDRRFDEIAGFADIGDFLDQPVKTYSSGMQMRLAFAVQTAVDPDILIVDEALSVGDSLFQAKCMNRLRRMLANGLTLIFVTHSIDLVPQVCRSALYLAGGLNRGFGPATPTVDLYLRDIRAAQYATELATPEGVAPAADRKALTALHLAPVAFRVDPTLDARAAGHRYGTGNARVRCVEVLADDGMPASHFNFRERITVRAHLESNKALEALNCCVLVRNQVGLEILHCTSFERGIRLPEMEPGGRAIVDIVFENTLRPGSYSIHYTINNTYSLEQQEILDLLEIAAVFEVRHDPANPIHYLVWHGFEFYTPPIETP